MRNADIAMILKEVADLLEIKGETAFKVRAYRKAVTSIEHLGIEVASLRSEGKLREIPGVGEAIAEKITEILDTGELQYHQRLRAEFPHGILVLMDVPGIGPKTAYRLCTELGISNLEQLEAALLDGRVSGLFRMGEKTAANILRHIQAARSREKRVPIGIALPLAEEIMDHLRRCFDLPDLTPAGSLRRFRDTVRDIDLMCTSDRAKEVIETFCSLPMVEAVIARGSTKGSILAHSGLQVDLRIVEPGSFGSLLQHFTGSREHNTTMRERAQRLGLKLSEYGITDVSAGVLERFTGEESFYRRTGLPWIPPELREGGLEILAAEQGRLPILLEEGDLRGDLHVHTSWSDGRDNIEAMALAARDMGYEYLAITDHSRGRGIARGLDAERLREQVDEVRAIDARLPGIRLLTGIELDIRADGSLDLPDEVLAGLDVVIASVHSSMNQDMDKMTARVLKAIEHPYVDIVAHPTCRILGERDPVAMDVESVLRAAARTGTALEINAMPDRLDLKDAHIYRARQLGVRLVLSTDAHCGQHVGLVRYGVRTARRGWCQAADIVNTRPLEEVVLKTGMLGASKREVATRHNE